MAACKQTAFELVQDVFSPCVAVLCSSDVEEICAKNNLSFVQMLQPFCRLNSEVTIRDPNNMPCPIKNFRIVMKHLHSQSPTPSVAKKMMHDIVALNIPPANDRLLTNTLSIDNYYLKYSSSTPWFEAYRDVFFQVTTSPEHEFVHNYLSCIFVVSSSHQDPLSQIHELSQQLTQYQNNQSNRWFFSFVFVYYILLHDVSSEDLRKAETIYQSMKTSYGATTCHLLQINSVSLKNANDPKEDNATAMPDPWTQFIPKYHAQNNIPCNQQIEDNLENEEMNLDDSVCSITNDCIHHPLLYNSSDSGKEYEFSLQNSTEDITLSGLASKAVKDSNKVKKHGVCLTQSDMDRIKCAIQDFCIQGLIPFIEKQIRMLSEQVANRKGIHRTLFGMSKKFFSNKPGAQSPTSSLNSVVYGPDAPELQVRKLGDLAFMFQMYEVAYQAYHNAKRDFSADQAWLHFAGASEMAALAVFMQNNPVQEYPMRYIESAITTYLHTCKLPELATRATFLSTECLKAKGLYGDAAAQFVRMPNDADLPSALCLEQAAFCYINCSPPKIRKFAFHIILAGHRFSKACQRKHALRSYKQAEQIYKSLGWNFANNHINFTIGRLSMQLNQIESACTAFAPLLVSKCELHPTEQSNYLREYLFVLKKLLSLKSAKDLPILPIPTINSEATKVLLAEDVSSCEDGSLHVKGRGFDRGDINNDVWEKLEEIVINQISNNFGPTNELQCFTSKTDNIKKPKAILGEIITIEIVVRNPLSVPLTIEDLYPLWIFYSDDEITTVVNNEPTIHERKYLNDVIETVILSRLTFEAHEEKKIHLLLTPKQVGTFSITGIAYRLLATTSHDFENSDSKADDPTSILSLQGKLCFNIKGHRLNKTAEQRASKVYSEDNRLNIAVLKPMAKLKVKFKAFPYNLFCGEVQKVMAELSNEGTETLTRVVVASPLPGLLAIGNPSDVDVGIFKEIIATQQPSPVIGDWNSDWVSEIFMADGSTCILHPGSSIEIPFWFKGPEVSGGHDLDLLFYYESEPAYNKLRYRLLQFSSVLVTYPSVSVVSCAMRSFCSEDKTINFHPASIPSSLRLSLAVENKSEEFDHVSLVQISCISKDWCFLPTDDSCRKGLSVIHFSETLMLSLKAIGFDPKSTVSSQQIRVFSHIPFGRVEVDISSTPCLDFNAKSALDLKSIMLPDYDGKPVPTMKEFDRLISESNVILLLVIIWKAKIRKNGEDHVIVGLHHIPIENIESSQVGMKNQFVEVPSNTEAMSESSEKKQSQILPNVPSDSLLMSILKCSLKHPFSVQHSFSNKRIVIVPIEFISHNTSDIELKVIIDSAIHSESLHQNQDDSSQMAYTFSWVNGSKREFLLKPYSTYQCVLYAMFCGPGTYDLSNLHILVNTAKDQYSVYSLPSYLIVISSSDSI